MSTQQSLIRSNNKLNTTISIVDFGAVPGSDNDCTTAIQAAIDYLSALGGGNLFFPAGTWYIKSTGGTVPITAHDDGTCSNADPIPAEAIDYQNYSILLPTGSVYIGLYGIPGLSIIDGGYTYGNASLNENITFHFGSGYGNVYNFTCRDLTFQNCFMAIAGLGIGMVTAVYENLIFNNCAFGTYFLQHERVRYNNIQANGTGGLIVIGGQWCSRDDNYNELGGFGDKSTYTNISYIYNRVMGDDEAAIDTYFDTYFYKTANNDTRLGPPIQPNTVAKAYPYRGICGFTFRSMSRYARPSNSNRFYQIAHAFSPRPALRSDASNACTIDTIYMESCGYQDNPNHTNPIGVGFTDPYLGEDTLVEAFIWGFNSTCFVMSIQAQFLYGTRLVEAGPEITPDDNAGSTFTINQTQRQFNRDVLFSGNVEIDSNGSTFYVPQYHNNRTSIAGLHISTLGCSTTITTDTNIDINQPNGGGTILALVTCNFGTGTNVYTALYVITLYHDGNNAPVATKIFGSHELLSVGVSDNNTMTISGVITGNTVAVLIGNV